MSLSRLVPFVALGLLAAAIPPGPSVDEADRARDLIKQFDGTWDVASSFMGMDTKATETNHVLSHGLSLVTEYRSPMGPGQEFEGHGLFGYDVKKGKWLSIWADNTDPSISVTEGHWSADGKVFTAEETIDMGQGPKAMVMLTELKGDGTRAFTMREKDSAADAAPLMKATYTRRAK